MVQLYRSWTSYTTPENSYTLSAALLTIAKKVETGCTGDENVEVYLQMEFYSAIKMNEFLKFVDE